MAQSFLGRGWGFAIKPNANGRLSYVSGDEKIRQSVLLILSTAAGERQMLPEFGCGIHDLVFQPNTAALRGIVQEKVRQALTRWEPRIDLLEVRVETPGDPRIEDDDVRILTLAEARNYLLIRIDYRVRSNNAFYNLVYPFYLNEGVGR
jgi:phage baseplate assembly protein W